MIERLSFSSLRAYLSDKQQFLRTYVRGEWNDMGDAVYVGKAVHRMIEATLKNTVVPLAQDALAYESEDLIKQRKTLQDYEKAVEQTITAYDSFQLYLKENDRDLHPVGIEQQLVIYPESMPFHLKGFIDVVNREKDGRVTVIDWKNTARFTPDKGSIAYRLQSVFYVMLIEATDMTPSYKSQFIEVHRTKRAYKIHEMTIEPDEVNAMRDLCALAFDEIVNGKNHFLPNPFSMFGGEESWQYFVESRKEE